MATNFAALYMMLDNDDDDVLNSAIQHLEEEEEEIISCLAQISSQLMPRHDHVQTQGFFETTIDQ